MYNKYKILKMISSRTKKNINIKVLATTDDMIGVQHYKSLPDTQFRRILCISNSILNPKTGIIWLDNQILRESTLWDTTDLTQWEPKPKFYKSIHGIYSSMPDNGYFHFLIEDLPRFIQVRNLNRQAHTIIGSSSKYIIQAINILNPDNHSLEVSPVKVENLYVSEKIHGRLFTIYDLSILKSTFSPYINQNMNKKIFVSRKVTGKFKTNKRGLERKLIIESIFVNYGFEIIYFEDIDFLEQIILSSSANCIAGFHGAGLSNMIWASNIKIIEITGNRKMRHFEHLAYICSHNYNLYSTTEPLSKLVKLL